MAGCIALLTHYLLWKHRVWFPAGETLAWREAFATALEGFAKRNFDAAEAGFKRTLELRPKDGPANFYLKQIADLRTHALPENWGGEVSLKEK